MLAKQVAREFHPYDFSEYVAIDDRRKGLHIPDLLEQNKYKSDHVHPNAAGYRKMAEAVHALLVETGAL